MVATTRPSGANAAGGPDDDRHVLCDTAMRWPDGRGAPAPPPASRHGDPASVLDQLRADRPGIEQAMGTVAALMRPPNDPFHERLVAAYPQIRRFLPLLIEAVELQATASGAVLGSASRLAVHSVNHDIA
jgi:hypothetical protein